MHNIQDKIYKHFGNVMTISGILHALLGIYLYQDIIKNMLRSGLINSADRTPEFFGVFWYEIAGLLLMFTGSILQHTIKHSGLVLPGKFGWYLLFIALSGCLLEPYSGFYAYIFLGLFIIRYKHKKTNTSDVSTDRF